MNPNFPHIYHPETKIIDEQLEEFSFPRMVGSEGEKQVQKLIYKQLKKINLESKGENVNYSLKNVSLYRIYYFCFTLLIILFDILLYLKNSIGIITIIIILLIMILIRFNFHPTSKQFGTSNNISYEKVSVKHREFAAKTALIILCAHYDSIGYRYSGKFYIILMKINRIVGILIILFSSIILINNSNFFDFSYDMVRYLLILCSIIPIFENVVNFLNHPENNSPGATDNASGVVVLLNLIKRLNDHQEIFQWCDLRFLFLTAEEMQSAGAKGYLQQHSTELHDYTKVYVINVDNINDELAILPMVPRYCKSQPLKKLRKSSLFLTDLFLHHANRLKIPLKEHSHAMQYGGDHLLFAEAGFESICLCSLTMDFIHGPTDTINHVKNQSILNGIELIYNVLLSLESDITTQIGLIEFR